LGKTDRGSRSSVPAIRSVVGLSVGGLGPSKASRVSAATTSSIAAYVLQVAKIESEGKLEHGEFRSQLDQPQQEMD